MSDIQIQKIKKKEITEELKESYLDYAMSVIVSRALPDVRDGLKPVQRRILWAMWETGLKAGVKYRKSAAVVGEVLKSYHPHGDIAVYDALARMAQDFSLRYPLIDGQGNWGCFTKDTKVKLTDGRSLNFGELIKEYKIGKKNYTYTFNNKTNQIEIAEIINPRLTKKRAKIIKVVLDNKQEIKCTLNHRFMLRNGEYKEAQDLKQGDSLMPIYERLSTKEDDPNAVDYSMVYQPQKNIWEFAHYFADRSMLGKQCWQNPEFREKMSQLMREWHKNRKNVVPVSERKNHKVVKIEFINKTADVYDLTINGTHNFALHAGVFVHNSIDGDNQAAMRYTECRLSKISEELLFDIEKETVDWQPNYDGTTQEPKVLPAKLPNLLLNGTSGIAVGMATSIPPHNLHEVIDAILYLTENPKSLNEDIFNFIKGPDFPTGGIIYDKKAIADAYSTGRGPITIRAKSEIQERAKSQMDIVITEIPYQVNKSELIIKMASLVQEKKIEGIKDLRDESDREGMRIVVELKSDVSAQKILNQLYKYTDLQKNFNLNMIALAGGIQPQMMSLKDILEFYIEHRKEVVRRRAEFDLKKAKERAHILEGIEKALSIIDKIIETIKKSKDRDEARENLIKKFKLTEIQANAILDMKLATLAALERKKIEDELAEKMKLIKELEILLASPQKILKVIKDELAELKEKYKGERRTQIVSGGLKEFKEEDLIPLEEAVIVMTADGYVKRMPPGTFKSQKRGGKGLIGSEVGEEDFLSHFISASTHDNILFFTDKGRAFQTKVYEIPVGSRTSKGKLVQNFLEIPSDENISAIINYPKGSKDFLVMATKNGVIKKTALEEFENVRRTGIIAIGLKSGDALKWVNLSSGKDEIILATANGQAIRFKESQLRPIGRSAAGVTAIRLKKNDFVAGLDIIRVNSNSKLLVVTENGFAKQTALKEYRIQSRGGSGIKTAKINSKTGSIVAIQIIGDEEELLALSSKGQIIRTKISDIRTAGRATSGVKIMRLKEKDKVMGVVIL